MEEITVVYKSIHPNMVCIMLGDQTTSNTIINYKFQLGYYWFTEYFTNQARKGLRPLGAN